MDDTEKQLEFILPDDTAAKNDNKDEPIVELVDENNEVISRSDDGADEDVHKKLKTLEKKLKEEIIESLVKSWNYLLFHKRLVKVCHCGCQRVLHYEIDWSSF
jgi:biopolymer transport protein ExbD